MKKNIFQIALVALFAGLSVVSCQKVVDQDNKMETPVLVSISADKVFSSGSATVTAKLSSETDRDVTVGLTTGTKLSQTFTDLIPEENITLGTITIPAGQKEATTTVSVDYADFEKGKYETQILVEGVSGANVSSSNAANIILLVGSSYVTVEFDDYLDDYGLGTYTVHMDMFSETDCEVSLAYVPVNAKFAPEEAITMDETVVVKAGETEATGTISIDLDKLEASNFWYVGVVITGVSEGPFEASSDPTFSGLDFTLPVDMSEEWDIEYVDKEYYDGDYSEVYFQTGIDSPYFDYFVTPADYVEEFSNSVIFPEFIASENGYLAPYMKQYTPAFLASKGFIKSSEKHKYFYGSDKEPGKYTLWIVGLGEDGYCTGEYAAVDFEVVADTPEYAAWLGKWVIGSTEDSDEPVIISINSAAQNIAYSIDGLEGLNTDENYLTALGIIDDNSGALGLYSNVQYFGLANLWYEGEDGGTYADVLMGVDKNKEASFESLDLLLGSVMFGADGNGYFSPGFGSEFTPYIAAKYVTVSDKGEIVGELSESYTKFKDETLVPYVEPEEPEEEVDSATDLVSRHGIIKHNPHRLDRSFRERIQANK